MNLLIENASQVVTCRLNKGKFKSGKELSDVGLLTNTSIYSENGIIQWVGKKLPLSIKKKNLKKIDGKNKTVLPGFVDSHTHSVFAGDRANEYSMRIQGKTYEEIAKAGGGIVNTMSATRKVNKKKLIELTLKRLKKSLEYGVTTIEIKSGYGLNTEAEIKMLEVIKELKKVSPIDIYATFLGAHAFPKDITREDYINSILYEMIPLISKRELAAFIDVFCEKNYYTPAETDRIFKQGMKFGLIPKLHTNQFNSIGGIENAINNKTITADHLEVMTDTEIKSLKGKNIIACLLPAVSYFLDIPYAPARKFILNNIPVALATDFNPGSSMTQNIQLVMSMAVHKLKMNIEETINAVTINGAAALNISDKTGSIDKGKKADMLLFDLSDYRHILYNFGVNNIETIIKGGIVLK
jgi:imidazolonepropionase